MTTCVFHSKLQMRPLEERSVSECSKKVSKTLKRCGVLGASSPLPTHFNSAVSLVPVRFCKEPSYRKLEGPAGAQHQERSIESATSCCVRLNRDCHHPQASSAPP